MRIWRHSPFVAVMSVVALGLGIGFTTTMFSIVHGATRPLPFEQAHEIVAVEKVAIDAKPADAATRPFDYMRWAEHARSFEALGAFESVALNLSGDGREPERLTGAAITANTFTLLGVPPQLGRTLQSDDMRLGAVPVVVLAHELWQRRFGSDPGIVGRTVRLTGVPHIVVGVMPARIGFPINASFWTALPFDDAGWVPGTGPAVRVFGRLADDASIAEAQAELDALTAAALVERGDPARVRVDVMPFQDIETPREVVRALSLLVVAVSFVLLIACANVANLLVARAAARARDIALQLALGASRRQLIVEHLRETLALSVPGAALGVVLANAGTGLFGAHTAHIIEAFWVDFRVDGVVLVFASTLAAVATLAAGLGPALRTARSNVADVLKDRPGASSITVSRTGRVLIGVQVALACGLLALTTVLARASLEIRSVPWPFDPSSILTFEFELPDSAVVRPEARNPRFAAVAQAIQNTPGVEASALVTALPGRGAGNWTFTLDAPGNAGSAPATTGVSFVSPEFFDLTRASARRGRLITWHDHEQSARVAVVNDSFVRRFSATRDPIGRRVFLGDRDFTIVGVVADLMAGDVQERTQDGVYLSILQSRPYGVRVMARGAVDPLALMPAIRESLRRVDPDMPVTEVFTLHEAVYRDKRVLDVLSTLFLIFGVGALALTAIGLYGVVSVSVTQRTRELGIRLALGATRRQVLGLVVRQGSRQLLIGLAAGLLLAMALSRAFAAAVEDLQPADAPLLAVIAVALTTTAAAALVVPAWRAARVQILQALRTE